MSKVGFFFFFFRALPSGTHLQAPPPPPPPPLPPPPFHHFPQKRTPTLSSPTTIISSPPFSIHTTKKKKKKKKARDTIAPWFTSFISALSYVRMTGTCYNKPGTRRRCLGRKFSFHVLPPLGRVNISSRCAVPYRFQTLYISNQILLI